MKLQILYIFAISSLLFLFFLSKIFEPDLITVEKAKKKNYGEWVKLRGQVKLKQSYNNFTLLKICDDTDCIFVFFNKPIENIDIDDHVEIIGKINKYKEKQVAGEEIRKMISQINAL
jgi:uncharacterized protein YdeI (BOF family)